MNKTEFIVVGVITLIVLAIWGSSNFLYSQNASKPNPDAKQYLEPVDPNFDTSTLDTISALATPAPAPSVSPLPSPSISPSPSPKSASASATLKASPTPQASSIFP